MFSRVWQVVKTEVGKVRMVEAKEEAKEERRRKEARRESKDQKKRG